MKKSSLSERNRVIASPVRWFVGGILWGVDILSGNAPQLEAQQPGEMPSARPTEEPDEPDFNPLPETLPAPGSRMPPAKNPADADLRYAALGLLFESEEKLGNWFFLTKRMGSRVDEILSPFFGRMWGQFFTQKQQKKIDQWVARGQSEVDRWVARGLQEEASSRQFVQHTVQTSVDQSIRYLAQNPELENLIHEQSTSLADQILAEIRQRTISADDYLEGILRYWFRRPPRTLLPPPSPAVQAQATWKFRDERVERQHGK